MNRLNRVNSMNYVIHGEVDLDLFGIKIKFFTPEIDYLTHGYF